MLQNRDVAIIVRRALPAFSAILVSIVLFSVAWTGEYFPHRQAVLYETDFPTSEIPQTPLSGFLADSGGFVANLDAEKSEEIIAGPDPRIEARLLSLFQEAERELFVNVYLLTAPSVVDALVSAKKRGVDVRVILEKDPYRLPGSNRAARDRLLSSGVSVFSSRDDFAYTHAKYVVADGKDYVFSTGNHTKSTFSKNREFFVFGHDPESAGFLRSVFESDFRGSPFVSPVPPRFYLAPADARRKILSFVRRAEKSVVVFAPSISDSEFVSTLNSLADEGKTVRVCLPKDASERDLSVFSSKVSAIRSSRAQLHAKTVWVDGSEVMIGSANFTENSLDRNREIGAVFASEKAVRTYETTLFRDCKW